MGQEGDFISVKFQSFFLRMWLGVKLESGKQRPDFSGRSSVMWSRVEFINHFWLNDKKSAIYFYHRAHSSPVYLKTSLTALIEHVKLETKGRYKCQTLDVYFGFGYYLLNFCLWLRTSN